MRSIIIPMCGDVEKSLRISDVCKLAAVDAYETLNVADDKVYFVVKHDDNVKHHLADMIWLNVPNATVVEIQDSTSAPDTIAQCIEKENIEGEIFIKDVGTKFTAEFPTETNYVSCADLNRMGNITPSNYSYVKVDDMGTINTICEKKVISNMFCCGGYGFKDAKQFVKYFHKLNAMVGNKFYISHIVFDMLLHDESFEMQKVENLKFFGE